MANAEVLPFDFKIFQKTVATYLTEVITLIDNLRETTEVENQMVKENRYTQAADPTLKFVAPQAKDPIPFINFSSLQNAVSKLEKSSATFSDLINSNSKPANVNQLNELIYKSERKLLGKGLPRRPWYRHTVYAPGFYTGYGVKTLPGVREAIEQRNFTEAQEQIEIAAQAIEEFNKQVEAANKILMMR